MSSCCVKTAAGGVVFGVTLLVSLSHFDRSDTKKEMKVRQKQPEEDSTSNNFPFSNTESTLLVEVDGDTL